MKLEDYEKEYYDEILDEEVSVETLEKFGVKKKTLSKEVYLRSIYGDEIVLSKKDEELAKNAKKMITHLNEEELGLKSELAEIYKSIDNSSFDDDFDRLGIKLSGEEN